jgi:hypothetical protein
MSSSWIASATSASATSQWVSRSLICGIKPASLCFASAIERSMGCARLHGAFERFGTAATLDTRCAGMPSVVVGAYGPRVGQGSASWHAQVPIGFRAATLSTQFLSRGFLRLWKQQKQMRLLARTATQSLAGYIAAERTAAGDFHQRRFQL